ncbi:protease inhibitor I42 family protein [bacterium]|nr:protease inhibitor I42 family protein [bacterium]MBP9809997.1 protease inhibitor I42 family protein [bacterium]
MTTKSSQSVSLTTNVSEAENGKTITVQAGSNLVITLPGNRSTGYSWSVINVVSSCCSGQSVELQGQPVYTTAFVPGGCNVVGRGGFYQFTFKIPPLCVSTIELAYQRPRSKLADKTFKVTIKH